MTYTNYYLKGTDKAAVEATLLAANLMQEVPLEDGEGTQLVAVAGVDIHHIGIISEGGEWDEEGNEIVAPTILEGWHTNLRTSLTIDVELISSILIPTPTSPLCIWAE